MRKIICLLLLIIAGYYSTMAQHKNKLECAKDFEAMLKKEHGEFYGQVSDGTRRYYLNPNDKRIWVLPVNGDTIFCDKAKTLVNVNHNMVDYTFYKGKEIILKTEYPYKNVKSFSIEHHKYEPFAFTVEMITKHKMHPNFKKFESILCHYVSENGKIKVFYGSMDYLAKTYSVVIALDKQTGELVDLIHTDIYSPDTWETKQKAFYHKHLAVDCPEYKYAYSKYSPYKNVRADQIQIRYLLWLNAQRKCEGMPHNFELADCYYKDIYEK